MDQCRPSSIFLPRGISSIGACAYAYNALSFPMASFAEVVDCDLLSLFCRPEFQTTVHEITHETSHACCLTDQDILVQPIVLSTSSSLAERHNTNAVKKRTLDGNLCEHDKVHSPPSLSPESDAISYLCQSPKVPGKFLVNAALAKFCTGTLLWGQSGAK